MKISPWLTPGLLALLCACSSPNPSVPHRAGAPPTAAEEPAPGPNPAQPAEVFPPTPAPPRTPAVALVGGEVVEIGELLSTWMHADSQGVRDLLERVVSNRLVDREAERLEIEIPEELVTAEYLRILSELEADLQVNLPGVSIDEFIASGKGLDPTMYRARLREDVRRRLRAERLVRVFIYSQEWVEARVIVIETEAEAAAALEKVRAGSPFARVAAETSIDPTGERGGRVPPILRMETGLSRLAFGTGVGELGGPIKEEGRWLVLQVEEIHAPLRGSWGEISSRIEASLQERPIEDPEYWNWKQEMQRRHPVDLGPFFELIGEPRPTLSSQF